MTLALNLDPVRLRDACRRVCELVRAEGGRALAIGGCVRDACLERVSRDVDLEVFGLDPKGIARVISPHYPLDQVGRAFAVMKLRGLPVDLAVPHRGRGETAAWAPELPPEEAAARRDFTINAIALDPLTGEVIDPFDGRGDLERGILRHCSDRFGEDPLRVLRAMQLAARFELEVAPDTVALCRTLAPDGIARERIFGEWCKLIVRGVRPSLGLAFLRDCGWVAHTPELEALIDCPQDPAWHPEGDVWVHTLHCMDAFARERIGDDREDLVVGLAVLCHDLGKPATTKVEEGRVTSRGHSQQGESLTRSFLERMTDERGLLDEVPPLVDAHLAPVALYEARAGDAAVRRLARRVGRIDRLVRVARADQMGRPPLEVGEFPAGAWLLERAHALDVAASAPRPLVLGRHLIAFGLTPGPHFAPILDACYRAQIDGQFTALEEGIAFARRIVERDRAAGD
jgi:tRNA nucleotidyltransferase (CCA-adding enzyme)